MLHRRRFGEAVFAILIALAATAAALMLLRPPSPLAAAERLFQALAFRLLAPTAPAAPRVVIIGITEATLAGFPYSAPIDRGFLAGLVDQLARAGVAAVGLDVVFDRPTEPAKDAALRRALLRADVPVIAISLGAEAPEPPDRRQFLRSFLDGALSGDANLARDRFDDMVRTHVPRDGATGQLSFPARIAAALGRAVPDHAFPILWRAQRPAVPTYPAESVSLLPAAWLAGRVALIGSLIPGLDEHRTLASAFGRPSFGVEIHAQVVSQLLDGRTPAAGLLPWREGMVAAGMAVCGAFASFLLAGWLAAGSVLLIAGGFEAAALTAYAWGQAPLPGLGPVLAAILAGGLMRVWRGGAERRDRRALRVLFSRFVSAPVVDEIMRARDQFLAGGRPRPQELTATVLFSDVAGFTAICERLPPAPLIAWLDRYVDTMVGIVMAHGGVVLRFVGDGILTAFGVPLPRQDDAAIAADARNAARCALAMEQAMARLNDGWRAAGLPEAGLRIGIHTGRLVAGSFGSGPRMEFCLLGDTANIGARLEQLGKEFADGSPRGCTIMVGEPTWRCLGGAFPGLPVGAIALRGRRERLAVYRIDTAAVRDATMPRSTDAVG